MTHEPHGPQSLVRHTPSLGLFPVQSSVSEMAGLGVGQASPHGQVTVRVRVFTPSMPQSSLLQSLQSLHSPTCQAGFGHCCVCVAAGLVSSSQEVVPPQAPGVQVTERLRLLLQVEPVQSLHAPHAPVTQAPSLALPPVQDRDVAPVHALPPHAGVGLLQARVCVPLAPQSLAEQELHADQPPSTGLLPVQARDDEPEQLLPPHAGVGFVQDLVCVPLAPQALAEQALQPVQPPSTGLLPVQARDDEPEQLLPPHAGVGFVQDLVCVPLAPQALAEQALQPVQPPSTGLLPVQARDDEPEQLLPPHAGAGLSQVRVCVPPTPQAFAEQALQFDHWPSTAAAPAQGRVSVVPLVPSSFRHSWPACAGAGLSQVRVCVPASPQADAEQALQSDQPPSTAVYLTHFSEFEPPCWPSHRHTWMVE